MYVSFEFVYIVIFFRYIFVLRIENKLDDYVFIYYWGKNDVWDGYGGVVVYIKSLILLISIIFELGVVVKKVNLDFKKFIIIDNICGLELLLFVRLEKKVMFYKLVVVFLLLLKC